MLTLGFVAFEGLGTGFGIVPALVAVSGVWDLWTARWLGVLERDAGKRLLQADDWPMPGRGSYFLQPLESQSRLGSA